MFEQWIKEFARSLKIKDQKDFFDIYYAVRHSDVPYKNPADAKNAILFAMKDNGAKVRAGGLKNGWLWRYPRMAPQSAKADMDRISLNVAPSVKMLEKLDDIISRDAGRAITSYKTPAYLESWGKRHDPITIYMHDAGIEYKRGLIKEIGRSMSVFARRGSKMDNAAVIGKEIAPGVYYNAEPDGNAVAKVVARIAKFPEIYKHLQDYLKNKAYFPSKYKNGFPVMSAGELWILERAADMLEQNQKEEILKIATVKVMVRSNAGGGKTRYFIPKKDADFQRLKIALKKMGVPAAEHESRRFGQRVMAQKM